MPRRQAQEPGRRDTAPWLRIDKLEAMAEADGVVIIVLFHRSNAGPQSIARCGELVGWIGKYLPPYGLPHGRPALELCSYA